MNPWRDIWTKPTATIQSLIFKNPSYGFKRISWIYGVTIALNFSKLFSLIMLYPLWVIVLGSLLSGIVFGTIAIIITTYVLQWCGRLIGGNAPFKQIRCVATWSSLPILINILIWIILIGVFKEQSFYSDFPLKATLENQAGLFLIVTLGQVTSSIWTLVILIQGLREVQGFSIWKGLLNVILSIIALVILSILINGMIGWFITKT